MSSVVYNMDVDKKIKVIKVEEGEAAKARKLVESIMEELVDGAVGGGGGNIKGKPKGVKTGIRGERGEVVEIEFVGAKGKSGFVPEVGKFVDRKYDCIGRGRGRGVCDICCGTCCSALRDMIKYFTRLELIPANPKVRECIVGGIYVLFIC